MISTIFLVSTLLLLEFFRASELRGSNNRHSLYLVTGYAMLGYWLAYLSIFGYISTGWPAPIQFLFE